MLPGSLVYASAFNGRDQLSSITNCINSRWIAVKVLSCQWKKSQIKDHINLQDTPLNHEKEKNKENPAQTVGADNLMDGLLL